MSALLDTNVLLRSVQPESERGRQAVQAVSKLIRGNETVCFCSQNVAEFWCVATRPSNLNGLGMSPEEARQEVASIEGLFTLLPDIPSIYAEWKRVVNDHRVQGVKVYDARLVAVANVYGIGSILTFNPDDFKRYGNLKVLHPSSINS